MIHRDCNYLFTAGYDGVDDYKSCNTAYYPPRTRRDTSKFDFKSFLPAIIKGVQCLGNEDNILDCLIQAITPILSSKFKALSPGSSRPVDDVAWVSCRGGLDVTVLAQKRRSLCS